MAKVKFILSEDFNPINVLKKHIKYFNNFEDLSKKYTVDIDHGYFWHLTDNKNFKISDNIGPRDMSSMGSRKATGLGDLMITSDLENWDLYYNFKEDEDGEESENITRPYAVLFDASDIDPKYIKQVSRGFGNEIYLNKSIANKLKVVGVYNIKDARKLNDKFENMIPSSKKELEALFNSR